MRVAPCEQCHYDLTSLRDLDGWVTCPECGTVQKRREEGWYGADHRTLLAILCGPALVTCALSATLTFILAGAKSTPSEVVLLWMGSVALYVFAAFIYPMPVAGIIITQSDRGVRKFRRWWSLTTSAWAINLAAGLGLLSAVAVIAWAVGRF